MLVDVFSKGVRGRDAEQALDRARITVNKNAIAKSACVAAPRCFNGDSNVTSARPSRANNRASTGSRFFTLRVISCTLTARPRRWQASMTFSGSPAASQRPAALRA